MPRWLLVSCVSLLATSCAAPSEDALDFRMRVRWGLTDPATPLPSEVDGLRVDVLIDGELTMFDSTRSVSALTDSDGNGRLDYVRTLPVGEELLLRITGRRGETPIYVGHVGLMTLREGERRYAEPAMFRIGEPTVLIASAVPGRVFHSATRLRDGRVLIAGGFGGVAATTCPADQPADTRCFAMTALADAWVYDPTTARFLAIDGGLLEARGGHTATELPDGRVLLAGGASEAILAMAPQTATAESSGYAVALLPRDDEGGDTALATFEIFDAELNAELEDTDADGDPGRGGLVGAADATASPGRLDRARFLATAAAVPGTSRVVIAGGAGDAAATFTVFDSARAGGYGVLAGEHDLVAPRVAAGAAAVGSGESASVWLVGGNDAASDADLAEIWRVADDAPSGATTSATEAPLAFPLQMPEVPASHPEWSLTRPLVEPIADGRKLVVLGWYGPLCAAGTTTVVFAGATADPVERCAFARRSFTVDVATGLALPTLTSGAHAFGASARLDDGRVLVSGGISSLVWDVNGSIDVLTGLVAADGSAAVSPAPLALDIARALHTSTALLDGGLLTVGGLRFDASVRSATLLGPEVLYLAESM